MKKALAVLLASQDPAHPRTVQALSRLKKIGRPALAECVEALGQVQHPASLEELLAAFLDNETLPFFVHHLTHPNAQIATGITKVCIKGTQYDPQRLLTLFADVKIPKVILGRILAQRKEQLPLKSLIAQLDTTDRDGRVVLLHLIERLATEAMIPDLIGATRSQNPTIRLNIVRTLARFSTEAVHKALSGLLNDPYKEIRQAALDSLAGLKIPLTADAMCRMLRDPDPAIQRRSKELLLQMHDPRTAHALIDLLQDEAEEVRQRAVEVLNAMPDSTLVQTLLGALRDKEWWVIVRAFDALRASGEVQLFVTILTLLKEEEAYIRGTAVEILKKDQRVFDSLVTTLAHQDMGMRARTVEALVTLEDKRAVPVFLRMLHETPEVGILVIPALAKLEDRQAIPPLVACLQGTNHVLRTEALRTLATLTDAAHAEQVIQAVVAVRETADAELKKAANDTASALMAKFAAVAASGSTPAAHTSARLVQPQSSSHDLIATAVEDRDTRSYIDTNTLEPDDRLVDRYRIIRRIGKGGFGSVILVEDTVLGEDIILKFVNRATESDQRTLRRFKRELLYARRITHKNVIRIHDFVILGKSYAIAMEYFPSHTLADELTQGAFSMQRGLKIIWDISCGMSAAHEVEVVHRDLKPENILIHDSGMLKVVDFGLAVVTHTDARLTKTGTVLGTPLYMAPEQVRARPIDARTDIYSLGVIMYEIFTGKPPYMADDPMAVLFQHVEGNPTPPRQLRPDISPELEALILKAMAVDPAERFQTMDDLRRSISALSKQDRTSQELWSQSAELESAELDMDVPVLVASL